MSEKTLLVVESPAKAKTINKYLGSNYIVEASVGHIKDLVKYNLGVDIKNDFQPKYITIKGKADIIKKLKQLAEKSAKVLIATDPDREGEAIAWHIAEEIKTVNKNIKRVLFNEITKTGIKKGIETPADIDVNLFMSQQARRVMDRLIGFQVSPFLSRAMIEKTTKALSAGRVQSVALRLICERESHIRGFVPIEYWQIIGDFEVQNKKSFKARLVTFDDKNIKNPEGSAGAPTEAERKEIEKKLAALHYIRTEEQAKSLISEINKESFLLKSVTKKEVRRKPLAPFTTSYLQQEASRRLGFSNSKTMSIAQKLYEGVSIGKEGEIGLITYMRTDSVRISPEAQKAAREHIKTNYGNDFLPDSPPVYATKSGNVQDAHEAIRPTSLELLPKDIKKSLSKDEGALYELIFNRFLASQMSAAILEQTTIDIQGGGFVFRATGSVVIFKGFLIVYDDIKEEENGNKNDKESSPILPKGLQQGQKAAARNITPVQSFTKPLSRYTEASLVKELDELGIGRPSTYAQIISTLQDREYVELIKKSFNATVLGEDVSKILTENFPDLFNVDFTAEMERELDIIGEGKKTYIEAMHHFYHPFHTSLQKAEAGGAIPDILCDKCGGKMVIKVSRNGRFLGCSNYPECKNTKPMPRGEKQEKAEPVLAEGITCDICGKPMYIRDGKYGKFYGCTDYPKCKGIKQIDTGVDCPKCGKGVLSERYSKKSRKKFYGCSRYPDCDYLSNYEPINKKCPTCGNSYLEIRFKKVAEGFEKYLKCPECKENFSI
ncbi:MAG: topoisomerase [Bacteroidota bacterium]|nr:topoisomerase [Bacteroidota bacterium]